MGLDLYEMDFRLYDQTLGRFMVIDPLAEYYGQISISPYAFARNNPISLNDPSGLCAGCDGYEYNQDQDGGPPNRRGHYDGERVKDKDKNVYQWHRQQTQIDMLVI